MAKKITDYIAKKNSSLVAVDDVKIIIPKINFESNVSAEVDSIVNTFGIFKISSLDNKDRFTANFPVEITLNVIERSVDEDNIILTYHKNDVIIDKMEYIANAKAANNFLTLMTTGKIDVKSGSELVKSFRNNLAMNNVKANVSNEIIEAMISELMRWKQDITIPFRLKTGKVDPNDYVILNIKDIARVSSVFGAMSFEDIKKALQASVAMTRSETKQRTSPVESVLYY